MIEGKRVAVVGGGLAGLAAAFRLAEHGFRVELFESRRCLGGRVSSFRDPRSGALVDYCQHVSMGCCTNLADFCRRSGIEPCFHRFLTLHFFGPDGKQCDIAASHWLPAPFHLMPSLMRLQYLGLTEKLRIVQAMIRLVRYPDTDDDDGPSIGDWLRQQQQTPRSIDRFWSVVLVSALGESLERASIYAARKVFVEGFLAAKQACEVLVPKVPLGELFGERLTSRLAELNVQWQVNAPVQQVNGNTSHVTGVMLSDGQRRESDYVILAVPWRRLAILLPDSISSVTRIAIDAHQITSSPITGVHLWFDRPIMSLSHAVLVDRLSQWVFLRGRGAVPQGDSQDGYYLQVVISASHDLARWNREEIIDRVVSELKNLWPDAFHARLLYGQIVTEREAVFSSRPGMERRRPLQRTPVKNLMICGDWTATGWPSTMEGAVRSGYLAAEGVLQGEGRREKLLVPGLPRGLLARWLLGNEEPITGRREQEA